MFVGEIIGNLGCDAERRKTNGEEFYSFRVASSYRYTDKSTGEVTEATQWVSVISKFVSENLLSYLKRGTKVFVRGRIDVKEYYGKDHQKHIGINMSASEIVLCGSSEPRVNNDVKPDNNEAPF